jgi:hypothetical protein
MNPDPRSHSDNANLPNINQPVTIIGTTVVFFVRLRITESKRNGSLT